MAELDSGVCVCVTDANNWEFEAIRFRVLHNFQNILAYWRKRVSNIAVYFLLFFFFPFKFRYYYH